jgi:hypothetical protein
MGDPLENQHDTAAGASAALDDWRSAYQKNQARRKFPGGGRLKMGQKAGKPGKGWSRTPKAQGPEFKTHLSGRPNT